MFGEITRMPTLRELRADRLLSIRELAQQAGVAPSSIYLIEAGRGTARLSTMRRLATALGVDPEAVAEFRQAIDAAIERPRPRGRTAQDSPRAGRV
jgi:transcriptional regulator with XRE-family HTH domain